MTATLTRTPREVGERMRVRRATKPRRQKVARAPRPPRPPLPAGWAAASSMLTLLAAVLLTFVLEVSAVGAVRHARAQAAAYDELRTDFANGVGPTGQLDVDGVLLPLGKPMAVLSIPSIGLREVVLEGTTGAVLQSGPGHRRDTVFPGQAGTSVIMGRQASYGGPFRRIATLQAGDAIQMVTGQSAEVIEYRVTDVRRAGDTGTVAVDPEVGKLTLVTGDGPLFMPSDSVRVDAELVTNPLPAPGFAFGSSALAPSEQAMGAADRSGVLSLFLWAQLMLALSVAMAWLRTRWGGTQTRMVAIPLIVLAGLQVAHHAARLLPNLL